MSSMSTRTPSVTFDMYWHSSSNLLTSLPSSTLHRNMFGSVEVRVGINCGYSLADCGTCSKPPRFADCMTTKEEPVSIKFHSENYCCLAHLKIP
mmetsp:Transcript_6027/g.10842  ORF Transcript_6027/g.10842 Transcript_6027/m.10842 type:complete len:94 (-) Transcript_6027:651-932(-)